MTTDPDRPRRAAPPQRPSAGWVFAPALGAFFAALALLAFQVRAGQDPALGPAQPAAQVQPKRRRILVRRVIERVIVHDAPADAPEVRTAAPRTTTTAPPQPAPAPAPLTTQSS